MLNVECFSMNSAFAIDVRGVTKKFGARTVVNDIAMQVRPGESSGTGVPPVCFRTVHFRNSQAGRPRHYKFRAASAVFTPRNKPLKRLSSFPSAATGLKPGVDQRQAGVNLFIRKPKATL